MPDADGRIPPVVVPDLPWLQKFEPGGRVRVAAPRRKRDQAHLDAVGTVLWADKHVVSVRLDAIPPQREELKIALFPGELRPHPDGEATP